MYGVHHIGLLCIDLKKISPLCITVSYTKERVIYQKIWEMILINCCTNLTFWHVVVDSGGFTFTFWKFLIFFYKKYSCLHFFPLYFVCLYLKNSMHNALLWLMELFPHYSLLLVEVGFPFCLSHSWSVRNNLSNLLTFSSLRHLDIFCLDPLHDV